MLLSAPEDFPREDYLSENEQMNLDKAFAELRDGLRFVVAGAKGASISAELQGMLEAFHRAYRQGVPTKGAHLLQDFRQRVLEAM